MELFEEDGSGDEIVCGRGNNAILSKDTGNGGGEDGKQRECR